MAEVAAGLQVILHAKLPAPVPLTMPLLCPSKAPDHACKNPELNLKTLQERAGFSLRLAPSAVGAAGAGDGVWLAGRARAGAVVGLYPGIVYTRTFYRQGLEPSILHHGCKHAA